MIYTYEQKQEIKELEEKKKEAKQKLIETNEDNYLNIMNECHYKIIEIKDKDSKDYGYKIRKDLEKSEADLSTPQQLLILLQAKTTIINSTTTQEDENPADLIFGRDTYVDRNFQEEILSKAQTIYDARKYYKLSKKTLTALIHGYTGQQEYEKALKKLKNLAYEGQSLFKVA